MTGCSGPNETLLMQAKDVVLGLEAQVLGPDLGLGARVFVNIPDASSASACRARPPALSN